MSELQKDGNIGTSDCVTLVYFDFSNLILHLILLIASITLVTMVAKEKSVSYTDFSLYFIVSISSVWYIYCSDPKHCNNNKKVTSESNFDFLVD